jgi:hypothetical protein
MSWGRVQISDRIQYVGHLIRRLNSPNLAYITLSRTIQAPVVDYGLI